jgi:hypothetical protein
LVTALRHPDLGAGTALALGNQLRRLAAAGLRVIETQVIRGHRVAQQKIDCAINKEDDDSYSFHWMSSFCAMPNRPTRSSAGTD